MRNRSMVMKSVDSKTALIGNVGLLCGLVMLSGCGSLFGNEGYFRSRSMDYQSAQTTTPLRVPEDVQTTAREQLYPIPDIQSGEHFVAESEQDVPRPEALLSVDQVAGIELRKDGDKQWLVVEGEGAKLYEDLRLFFKSSGIPLQAAPTYEPEVANQLETQWLQPSEKQDTGFWEALKNSVKRSDRDLLRQKFQVTMQPGEAASQHNIYVDQQQVTLPEASASPETQAWPSQSADTGAVSAFYQELSNYLADDTVRFRRSSLFSQTLSAQANATLTRDGNGYPVLELAGDFARNWLAVGEALAKTSLKVTDRDRSLGIYYIQQPGNEEEDAVWQLKLNRAATNVLVAVQIDDDELAPVGASEEILDQVIAEL